LQQDEDYNRLERYHTLKPNYLAYIAVHPKDRLWAQMLQAHLKKPLQSIGEMRSSYLQDTDEEEPYSALVTPQDRIRNSQYFLLVVTPWAMAEPEILSRVEDFQSSNPDDWTDRLLTLVLADSPLPPSVAGARHFHFQEPTPAAYQEKLRQLLAALSSLPATTFDLSPQLDPEWESPPETLDVPIRHRLIGWIASVFQRGNPHPFAVLGAINIDNSRVEQLKSFLTAELKANYILVYATGDDAPITAAVRITEALRKAFGGSDDISIAELERILTDLDRLSAFGAPVGLLQDYLQWVATRASTRLKFHETMHLEALSSVYIDLKLSPVSPTPGPVLVQGPPTLQALLGAISENLTAPRCIALLGNPGAGKTTLLRTLAWSEALKPPDQAIRWVPVLQNISDLFTEGDFLLDHVIRRFQQAHHRRRGLHTILETAAQEGKLLLLLDGFDEVPSSQRHVVTEAIREIHKRWKNICIVLSSRRFGAHQIPKWFQIYNILPLTEDDQTKFLHHWFRSDGDSADNEHLRTALNMIRTDRQLSFLASNPLYLTIMAFLIGNDQQLARNRQLLHREVMTTLLEGLHQEEDSTPIPLAPVVRQVLNDIALGMTSDSTDNESVNRLKLRVFEGDPARLAMLQRVPRWKRNLSSFFDDIAEKTGVLGPHDGPDVDWRFSHRTVKESQTAEALEAKIRESAGGRYSVVEHARSIPMESGQWVEPYALFLSSHPDRELGGEILESNPDLARAILHSHPELVEEHLHRLPNWVDRCNIISGLPQQYGSPDESLKALASLHIVDEEKGGFTNGNDLYFIHKAMFDCCGQPEDSPEWEATRDRLYSRVSCDDPGAFQRVYSVYLQSMISLWVRISPGEFLMGSPEGEGEINEQPQVQVSIRRGFRLSATPITNRQYALFDSSHRFDCSSSDHPATDVTHFQAMAFCHWLSTWLPGAKGARLPFEEEWEYFCRAGTVTKYWFGDDEKQAEAYLAKPQGGPGGDPPPVATCAPNPWGLFDAHGLVWELTLSPWEAYGPDRRVGQLSEWGGLLRTGLPLTPGEKYATRGGSLKDRPDQARSASRNLLFTHEPSPDVGFRVLIPGT